MKTEKKMIENVTVDDATAKEIVEDPSSHLLFSTVRHPFERLVSVYRNKFEDARTFIQWYGNLSFPEFVQLVIREKSQVCVQKKQACIIANMNPHWRPLSLSSCGFCYIPFTGPTDLRMRQHLLSSLGGVQIK